MTVTISSVKNPTQKHVVETQAEFEAAFEAHWSPVYTLLLRLTGDPDEAQDLALEVFYRLYRNPPASRDGQSLGGWLYRVALNLGYNALRALRRRSRYEQNAGEQALLQRAAADPADEVERRLERQQVRQVLLRLKPRLAHLLILRYSGLSYAEIASALQVSPGSVGTLLARAEQEFEKLNQSEKDT